MLVTTSPRPKLGGHSRQERPIARITLTITMLCAVVAAVAFWPSTTPAEPQPKSVLLGVSAAYADAHTACDRRALNRAITFYRQHYRAHREAMWQPGPVPRVWYRDCVALQRRAINWRDRADVARIELVEWRVYHYGWQDWLPGGWYRIGVCESGADPPNWQHNSGSYQGAFGFAPSSYDGFKGAADPDAGPYPENADQATPRQQYEVALAIYRRYGLTGWGCRGHY